jgi:hypothetical protein
VEVRAVRVGTVLYGFCGGYFGRDSYSDKRVEAVGADWVVAREEYGSPVMANCAPEDLEGYTEKPEEENW